MAEEKGQSIFLDVFRRADKNDDSALSWQEFKTFFSDGVMSEAELDSLFHEIDTHNSNNIDTGELCTYFSQHLGPFKQIFATLEEMNSHVSLALNNTSKEYDDLGKTQQFVTRFLLREVINQLYALQKPVDTASDALDLKAAESGVESAASSDWSTGAASGPTPGRVGRRARRQQSYTSQSSHEPGLGIGGGALSAQVDRLRSLMDRLETRVSFDMPEEQIDIEQDTLMFIVQRRLAVEEDCEKAFRTSLKAYIDACNTNPNCYHLSVRSFKGSPHYSIYEIWESDKLWKEHLMSAEAKGFQHANVDNLALPETVNTLSVPECWWKRD